MDDEQYTHLLFIDADIAFNPESIFRMLDLDEDVVTGVYPRKVIDWTKTIKKVKENPKIKGIPKLSRVCNIVFHY